MKIPGVKFQSTEASCGAAALANYFVMTGYSDLSEQQIMDIAGTNWNGTDVKQMNKALRFANLESEKVNDRPFMAMLALHNPSSPIICLVDQHQHWVVATSCFEKRVLVADGAGTHPVYFMEAAEFQKRWEFNNKCYGLYVTRKVD